MKYLFSAISILCILILSSCGKPVADFLYTDAVYKAPTVVSFENKSEKNATYLWDFGDGNTSTMGSPNHRFTQSGNYAVTLKVTDLNGKTTTKKMRILVRPPDDCLVELTTEYGPILMKLSDKTPKHRDNFYKLSEEGFYNGLIFHRVINNFMIQGGDPNSKNAPTNKSLGSGGPGYTVDAEFTPDLIHVKGAIAAARMSDEMNPTKSSSGSQFYIVHGKPVTEKDLEAISRRNGISYTDIQKKAYLEKGGTPFLDGNYTVFGEVIDGYPVIDSIAQKATNRSNRPLKDITLKMEIIH